MREERFHEDAEHVLFQDLYHSRQKFHTLLAARRALCQNGLPFCAICDSANHFGKGHGALSDTGKEFSKNTKRMAFQ